MDYEKEFGLRLSKLRLEKGVSARDMSLSLGKNAGYINSIERGKTLPKMSTFFSICESLEITPVEFFDYNLQHPADLARLSRYLMLMNDRQREHAEAILKDLSTLSQLQGKKK